MSIASELVERDLYPAPLWLPQLFDGTLEWVRMVRFEAEDYRAAPFLDKRGMRPEMAAAMMPYALLDRLTPKDARQDAHWIFHIGHVGSTLISRLLGEVDGVLALREPRVLRSLTPMGEAMRAERLPVLRALLSRMFGDGQRAMVKATSSVCDHAAALIGPPDDGGRAAMIGMQPERFIAARLVRHRPDLRNGAPERLTRLARRIPDLDLAMANSDDARLAAISWATEASAVEAAAEAVSPERLYFLDFDAFLPDPLGGMEALARHFELRVDRADLEAIVEGPLMSHYSKNSAKPFDASQRDAEIAAQLVEDREEIRAAMRWLESTATRSSLLAAALDRYS